MSTRYHRFAWKPRLFVDVAGLRREGTRNQRRRLTYQTLELGSNNFSVTLVASLGFFTSSYALFASNIALPMLRFVYWPNAANSTHESAFNDATVGGCVLGMLFFGVCADVFGRRKTYGYELIVLMLGTLGLVTSSAGYVPLNLIQDKGTQSVDYSSVGSMNIYSWLWFWRFVSGIGCGGEYPLSATIASEFAPTANRARMLTIVFAMQAFGATSSAVLSLAIISIVRNRDSYDESNREATARAVDQIWRWVVGLALVPAFFTSVLRFIIPESPRFTLDVRDDPYTASEEAMRLSCSDAGHPLADRIFLHNPMPEDIERVTSLTTTQSGDEASGVQSTTIVQYFWKSGNWRYLAGTALCWLMVDLATFADDLNNASIISTLWNGPSAASNQNLKGSHSSTQLDTKILETLFVNDIHLLIVESISWIAGGVLLAVFVTKVNRKLMTWNMFLVSGALYIATGATVSRASSSTWGVSLVLYALIKFANAFGIGPLTFIIPAELFPTKYRASCYGIAAASGKVGALLRSLFLRYVTFKNAKPSDPGSAWQGYMLMIAAAPVFVGALICWTWIPELQHPSGESKTLEQLAEGRKPRARAGVAESAES